jgi:2-oxoglutarate dehydrogenase E2 component (dihydrolipoamide succinyltransferase)
VTSSRTDTETVDVTMPQMGVSVAEGTIVEWKHAVGDPIVADETICDITTDKIDTEVPAPCSGMLAEILVGVGETVDVGTVLARIATGDDAAAPTAPAGNGNGNGHAAAPARHYSPVVQRIAAEHGIDLATIEGTGRDGRVRKQDVLAAVADQIGPAPAREEPLHIESPYVHEEPAAPAPQTGGSLSRMRRQIGEHMKRSLDTAATCTTWMEADMGRVEAARAAAKLTALPIVARCTVDALREHPALNATLDGERYTVHEDVNLGIAVSLGDEGLIVPVIHKAQELSAEGLSARIKDLAKRARAGRLSPDEVHGATFTVTNPGQYGSIMATPVINQPQVAILDLEAVVKRAVVVTGQDGSDMIAIRPQTILGLSWDHRALDGVLAAQFLQTLRRRLESWDG